MPELKEIDSTLVTVGQPAEGGCCWTSFGEAPTLPTDAASKMADLGFESLGDLSEDGYTESKSITSNKFRGWHGSVVLTSVSEEDRTFQCSFIEVNRPSVAKLRYGSANVEAAADGSVAKIADRVGTSETFPLVFDELESNGYLRRTIVKKATIDSFDDVPHQRGSLMVYGMTFTVIDTGDGEPVVVYRAKPASGQTGSTGSAGSTGATGQSLSAKAGA